MSKKIARKEKSYENEARLLAAAASVIEEAGFRSVVRRKRGSTKLIDAEAADGNALCFWLKLGWSDAPFAAIQFGMFSGPERSKRSDEEFIDFVREQCDRMKSRGATHALLMHKGSFSIALRIDDLASCLKEQMRRFPKSARNTNSPTLWFFVPRPTANPGLAEIVVKRAISLEALADRSSVTAEEPTARSRFAQVEERIAQATFRYRVGERCGWRCAITGCMIEAALDAAHLPGRDWRRHNEAIDGVLLRADIHRLLDAGLASIEEGCFRVAEAAKKEYGDFDGCTLKGAREASTRRIAA